MCDSDLLWSRPLRVRVLVVVVGLIVFSASCGGGDSGSGVFDAGSDAPTAEPTDESGGNDADPERSAATPAGFDFPQGAPEEAGGVDGLIPELSAIPLPDTPVVFSRGFAYTADQDPRQTAGQRLHFTSEAEAIAVFYLRELPVAGFVLVAGIGEGITDPADVAGELRKRERVTILFNDPAGIPGRLIIQPSPWSASLMVIALSRSGTR